VKPAKRKRPSLPAVSEEMKAWSSALATEVSVWPNVAAKSFFGFTAIYRGKYMFAALPRTRGWGTANSLAFKLERCPASLQKRLSADARIGYTLMQKARWFTFELSSDADLHDALDWLGRAYEAAGKPKQSH
jgi:hypothetical protein